MLINIRRVTALLTSYFYTAVGYASSVTSSFMSISAVVVF